MRVSLPTLLIVAAQDGARKWESHHISVLRFAIGHANHANAVPIDEYVFSNDSSRKGWWAKRNSR
jgi:hypothetical protein